MDKSFFEARVEVPKLSGFDKSFQNLYTAPVGTIVPALFDEVVSGSVIDLEMAASCSLPPLASDTFMRCSLKVEAFFVPMRLCYGGFEHFFVGDTFEVADSGDYFEKTVNRLPRLNIVGSGSVSSDNLVIVKELFGAGSLCDYLGFKSQVNNDWTLPQDGIDINLLPFIAYHKCYDDWYRSSLVQRSGFAPLLPGSSGIPVSTLPYVVDVDHDGDLYFDLTEAVDYDPEFKPDFFFADGVSVLSLRQRNFGFDYFTCATPSPQNGDAARVTLDSSNLANGFTISQLRSMNSLQQFRERNNLAGDRYVDRLYAQYGVRPSDGIAQRVLCIASGEFEVYSKGIFENSNNTTSGQSTNPFGGQLGSRGGSASASGTLNICHGFRCAEPGYIFVMTSLVPRVTYAMGLSPILLRYVKANSIGEMANPILQNIGPEPIYVRELSDQPGNVTDVFGYTDRYGSFKAKFDELHGLLREGESLSSFAAQRYLRADSDPRIDSEFLEIPKNYLDNVTAVSGDLSKYGVWVDTYFKYRVSMPLARYSLPTLQDPAYEHGNSINVRRGGFRF